MENNNEKKGEFFHDVKQQLYKEEIQTINPRDISGPVIRVRGTFGVLTPLVVLYRKYPKKFLVISREMQYGPRRPGRAVRSFFDNCLAFLASII